MLREINFKVFRKLLRRSKLKSITIDIEPEWSMEKATRKVLSLEACSSSKAHQCTKSPLSGSAAHIGVRPDQILASQGVANKALGSPYDH
jgi:hypothetical protein